MSNYTQQNIIWGHWEWPDLWLGTSCTPGPWSCMKWVVLTTLSGAGVVAEMTPTNTSDTDRLRVRTDRAR